MPELPEVETIRAGLKRLIIGKKILGVHVFDSPKSFPNEAAAVEEFLIGAKITEVQRRGKALLIHLDTNYTLMTHLKMTGQLLFVGDERWAGGHPNDSFLHDLPDRLTRVEIDFADDSRLFFNDQRKFGWMKLLPTPELENVNFLRKLGPEPLDPQTKPQDFVARIRRRQNSMIKPALLDQSVVAGVGNIYADESLWAAKIHPESRVKNLDDAQLELLFAELKNILKFSIEQGGSTDRNYVDAQGRKGNYLSFANVFRREGQPCQRHFEQEIIKIKVGGRGTHICPICQARAK